MEDNKNKGTETESVLKEATVSKELYDRKVSELLEKNRALQTQLDSRLTDDEKKAQETERLNNEINRLNDVIKRGQLETSLVGIGFNKDTSEKMSDSLLNGDLEGFITDLGAHLTNLSNLHAQEVAKAKLESIPHPEDKGAPSKSKPTRKEVSKMTPAEKQKLYAEDPEYFKSLYK